jgi:hypothetical protein
VLPGSRGKAALRRHERAGFRIDACGSRSRGHLWELEDTMKLLCSFTFLATNLVAQAPQDGVKIPRPPSAGTVKTAALPKTKTGSPITPGTTTAAAHAAPDAAVTPLVKNAAVDAATAGIARQLSEPEFVAIDEPGDGSVWAVAASYKAAFDASGWRYIGRPLAGAPDVQPIGFRVTGATVAGQALRLDAPARSRNDRRIAYDRGSLVETIDVAGRGVEQMFHFAQLPGRGEIVVCMAVDTALAASNGAEGIVFEGPFDRVGYSPAIAIDANGERVAAPTSYAEGALTIRVPAEFVARAALPLRIDPLVSTLQVTTYANDIAEPDVAWDESAQVWAVTFSRLFGGADWDCYVQRVSLANTLVGGLAAVDGTSTAWQHARIANLDAYDRFMVVCQTRSGTNPWAIQGRIFDNAAVAQTAQFAVASTVLDEINPDIGGDPAGAPTYFTVVWEHAFSPTDHDIYARQVQFDGVLRGSQPTYVQNDGDNQTRPSISKSDGGGAVSSQRFVIAWQETYGPGDEDIHGAMMTWDGNIVPVNGNGWFGIQTSFDNEEFPSCSTPTIPGSNGTRLILVAYERTNSNNGDIVGTCFTQSGTIVAFANLTELENDPARLAWPQRRPTVDSDGLRFVLGYHEVFNGTSNDLDTRVSIVSRAGGGLFVSENAVTLGFTTNRESDVRIAGRYGTSGTPSNDFNAVEDRQSQAGANHLVNSHRYTSAPTGRFLTRSTACGTHTINVGGQALPGGVITFGSSPTLAIPGFVLGGAISAPVGPCPGCTLGVDGFLAIGSGYVVNVPNDPALVGAQFSAQGFVFQNSGAPCINQIQLTDTIDVTIG